LHSLNISSYRTAKYIVQAISGSNVQAQEILMIHDGTDVYMTEYSQVLGSSNSVITTFDASISGGNMNLLVTPVNAITTYIASCTALRI
jgi:FlaA1/EpsC-like NDP-sugar epimerase